MRKTIFVAFIAIAAITMSSFTLFSHSAASSQSALAKAAGAETFQVNESFEVDFIDFSPCTGEPIAFTGQAHQTFHGVVNNNKAKVTMHVNTQGVSGIGEFSGRTYNLIVVQNVSESATVEGCVVTQRATLTYKMVARGEDGTDDDFTVKINQAVTYNYCTGEYTVTRDKVSVECN